MKWRGVAAGGVTLFFLVCVLPVFCDTFEHVRLDLFVITACCCHQDLMQDFERGKLESFKQEHAVLKEKQLRLLKEVGIAKHMVLIGTDDDI